METVVKERKEYSSEISEKLGKSISDQIASSKVEQVKLFKSYNVAMEDLKVKFCKLYLFFLFLLLLFRQNLEALRLRKTSIWMRFIRKVLQTKHMKKNQRKESSGDKVYDFFAHRLKH